MVTFDFDMDLSAINTLDMDMGVAVISVGQGGTSDYTELTNKPSVNGVELAGNKTSAELKLYGEDNEPPYPVTSVNGEIGDIVLTATDIGAVKDVDAVISHSISMGRAADTNVANYSVATGEGCEASGDWSFASGYYSKATGVVSRAHGNRVTASGKMSVAEGTGTVATANNAHAEGDSTQATANSTHAEGYRTKATRNMAHAEGGYSEATALYSHAEGWQTRANSAYQHAEGKANIADNAGRYLHIIGNGTSDTNRSNAHTVDTSGNAWYAGDVYVGSTSGTNKDDGSKKLIAADDDVITNLQTQIEALTARVEALENNGG